MKFLGIVLKSPSDKEKLWGAGFIIAFGTFCCLLSLMGVNISSNFPIFFTAVVVGVVTNMYSIKPWLGWQHVVAILVISLVSFMTAVMVLKTF